MSKDFLSKISTYFAVSEDMIPQNGEDSYIYSFNENKGLVGVFDGCGGIGSRRYPEFDGKTGAYIASRVVGECIADWFEEYSLREYSSDKCSEISEKLNYTLKNIKSSVSSGMIKGAMTKDFPTTLSMTVLEEVNRKMLASFIWAGDSRGYILTENGLVQVTRDDIDDSVDALENILNDGVLTNVISADGRYILHEKSIFPGEQCIVFNATDGCFGYLKTPMEFEYLILYTLSCSGNINEWKKAICNKVKQYTGDDYSISMVAVGFDSFDKMQKFYSKRMDTLYDKYISNLEGATNEEIKQLWDEYKKTYYEKE